MNLYPILLSVSAFVSTMSGGFVVAKFRSNLGLISAFAAGVLIAVPLFDLLPESIKLARQVAISVEQIMYAVAGGFVFLYVLERYFSVHRVCEQGICRNKRHPKGGLFGALELSAHSFMDGFAIGVGFHYGFDVGIIVSVAVISHDFSDGINTMTIMLNSGNSLKSSIKMLVLDAIAPVLGATSTLIFTMPERYLVLILSFFAGGFIYLGASEILPEVHEGNPSLPSIVSTIIGFLLIFGITRFLNL